GDPAGPHGERDPVDRDGPPVPFADVTYVDHPAHGRNGRAAAQSAKVAVSADESGRPPGGRRDTYAAGHATSSRRSRGGGRARAPGGRIPGRPSAVGRGG